MLVCRTAKLNSWPSWSHFTATHLGSNTSQYMDWVVGGTCQILLIILCTWFSIIRVIVLFQILGVGEQFSLDIQEQAGCDGGSVRAMRHDFPSKYSEICKFLVIMWIMTGLLGRCLFDALRFWLHRSPYSLRCWTNNTLATRSLSSKYGPVYHARQRYIGETKGHISWLTFHMYR